MYGRGIPDHSHDSDCSQGHRNVAHSRCYYHRSSVLAQLVNHRTHHIGNSQGAMSDQLHH